MGIDKIMFKKSILFSLVFYIAFNASFLAGEIALNRLDYLTWNQLEHLRDGVDYSLFSGDVLMLNICQAGNKLIFRNPMILQEPYFSMSDELYLIQIDDHTRYTSGSFYIKSMLEYDKKALGHTFGYMIFGANNNVLFIPRLIDFDYSQWPGVWSYQAYMEESDIVFWLERESDKPASTLKLCKHNALVWDFPLIKNKYAQMDIYWESASVRDFAMSFFRGIKQSHPEIVSWRLSNCKGIMYGWEE